MTLSRFKLVTIITEPILVPEIEKDIRKVGSSGITTTQVHGEGSRHLQSGEIPGSKVKNECVVSPPVAKQIMRHVSENYFENYSVIIYAADIEILRHEKFQEKTK